MPDVCRQTTAAPAVRTANARMTMSRALSPKFSSFGAAGSIVIVCQCVSP